jgi:hypothetical protein
VSRAGSGQGQLDRPREPGHHGRAGGTEGARKGATLAPGDSGEVVVPLDAQLPNGPWAGELTLRSGLVQHNARAALTFPSTPGSVGAAVASVAPQGDFPTSVVAWLSALALAALCLLLSRFLRRRR